MQLVFFIRDPLTSALVYEIPVARGRYSCGTELHTGITIFVK